MYRQKEQQRGFAVVLALTLIAALALITLFALEQARREQKFANVAATALQVEQSCLSLGSSLIRMLAAQPSNWHNLTGQWCLSENASLSRSCPGAFARVDNRARVDMASGGAALTLSTSAQAHGVGCGEEITLQQRNNQIVISKRLRTEGW